jgi:hypothetical protein
MNLGHRFEVANALCGHEFITLQHEHAPLIATYELPEPTTRRSGVHSNLRPLEVIECAA